MHVTIVHVHVRAENVNDFIEATGLNHQASVQEAGNQIIYDTPGFNYLKALP